MAGKITEYPAIDTLLFPSTGDLYDVSQITAVILMPPSVVYESRKVTFEEFSDAILALIPPEAQDLESVLTVGNTTGDIHILSDDGFSHLIAEVNQAGLYWENPGGAQAYASANSSSVYLSYNDIGGSGNVGVLQMDAGSTYNIHSLWLRNTSPLFSWNAAPGNALLEADADSFMYEVSSATSRVFVSDTVAYLTLDNYTANIISLETEQLLLVHPAIINANAAIFYYQDGNGTEIYGEEDNVFITVDAATTRYIQITNSQIKLKHDALIAIETAEIRSNSTIYFSGSNGIDTTITGGTDRLKIGVTNAEAIDYGNGSIEHNFTGLIKGKILFNAGAAGAGMAAAKFQDGVVLTSPEHGAVEYDGTNLFFTREGIVREYVLVGDTGGGAPATNLIGVIVDYYGTSATRVLTTPDTWVTFKKGANTYKIPGYL